MMSSGMRAERMEEVGVADMMMAREARYHMQRTMLARYPGAALVCLTMNIAGPVKRTPLIERAFAWGDEAVGALLGGWAVLFHAAISEKSGPESVYAVSGDAGAIKRRLCGLEDGSAMGRLLDVDVIAPDGEKISRTDIGMPQRKCLLCGQDAPVCARSRAHTAAELFARANAIMDKHVSDLYAESIAQAAQRALLYEVAVTPKPGLVDRANAGAHRDMDIFTFIDSACALRPYFEACARVGMAHRGGDPRACFDALRGRGLLAEAAMNRATGGVNTHKGAIFSLGVYAAALGMGGGGERAEAALARCGEMTRERMQAEMEAILAREAKTFGEAIYQSSGVGGVRAEAAGGFACVRESGLVRLRAALDAGLHLNDAGLCALVSLMARTEDTNCVRRGGMEAAAELRRSALAMDARILEAIGAGTLLQEMEMIRAELSQWDAQISAGGVSPGGSADMLALTLFAHLMDARPA